jgi:hypothetical protein
MKTPQSFDTLGTAHTLMHDWIPEDLNPYFIILLTVFSWPAQPLVGFVVNTDLTVYHRTIYKDIARELFRN